MLKRVESCSYNLNRLVKKLQIYVTLKAQFESQRSQENLFCFTINLLKKYTVPIVKLPLRV